MPKFAFTGRDASTANLILANWNRQVSKWDREARTVKNYNALNGGSLSDYLSFRDLSIYQTLNDFRAAVKARQLMAYDRIITQRVRYQLSPRQGRSNPLPPGGFLYLAVLYNHGQGANFLGYYDALAEQTPTHIDDWM